MVNTFDFFQSFCCSVPGHLWRAPHQVLCLSSPVLLLKAQPLFYHIYFKYIYMVKHIYYPQDFAHITDGCN